MNKFIAVVIKLSITALSACASPHSADVGQCDDLASSCERLAFKCMDIKKELDICRDPNAAKDGGKF